MKYRLCSILLIALAAVGRPLPLQAQTEIVAKVINSVPNEQDPSLELSTLFTVFDDKGFPIPADALQFEEPAQIQLLTSSSAPAPATIDVATTPLKIALVLDNSGSMDGFMADAKAAAINFVQRAPSNAEIAVFTFSDDLALKEDFRPKDQFDLVINEIQAIENRASGTGNTCIYEAAFGAINAITNAQNKSPNDRRAIVLFTDGRDREAGRQDCGDIEEGNVITEATKSGAIPIQIHTIALCKEPSCKNIDQDKLKSLSNATFAYYKPGLVNDLNTMFDTILLGLNSQWIAKANVLAIRGENRANLTFKVNIKDTDLERTFDLPVTFTSNTDYSADPAAVTMPMPTYIVEQDIYSTQLEVKNPDAIKQIIIEVVNEKGSVTKKTFDVISSTMPITISTENFADQKDHTFQVSAIGLDGNKIRNDKGEILDTKVLRYEPQAQAQFNFNVKDAEIDWPRPTLLVTVTDILRVRPDGALLYKVLVKAESEVVTDTVEAALDVTAFKGKDAVLRVALAPEELTKVQAAGGKRAYTISVTMREEGASQDVTRAPERPDAPTLPRQLSFVQRIILTLSNPSVLGAILVIALIAAAMAVYLVTRKKEQDELPPAIVNVSGQTSYAAPNAKPRIKQLEAERQPLQPAAQLATRASSDATVLDLNSDATVLEPQMALRIKVLKTPDPADQRETVITSFPCVIGRHQADFTIAGDRSLSRTHAEIAIQDDTFMLRDCNSVNGTFIDGVKLKSGASADFGKRSTVRLGSHTELEIEPQR
jgi:hypothetical protein